MEPFEVSRPVTRGVLVIPQYLPSDRESRVVRDYTGDSETLYWITCPECKSRVDVKG